MDKLPQITIGMGVILIVLGVATWLLTGQSSVTALIPSFFGLGLVVMGGLALREKMRKHAMHVAAVIGLLGMFGAGSRAIPAVLEQGIARVATGSQLIMTILMLIFTVLCVKSFIDARKSQNASEM
ncbi:MAG: hypothetical protein AAF541_10610 [Pseudomonadota bacterium]